MVHKPTGIVATCQNGRSQHENREECLRVLKSRLYQLEIEGQERRLLKLKVCSQPMNGEARFEAMSCIHIA